MSRARTVVELPLHPGAGSVNRVHLLIHSGSRLQAFQPHIASVWNRLIRSPSGGGTFISFRTASREGTARRHQGR